MGTPFIAEIRIMSFGFAPRGWALCNGQLLPINQNQALFSLLGTTYGGNGTTNFALPNLQGRTPLHFGNGFSLGQQGGEQTHTLSIGALPTHTHALQATGANGTGPVATNGVLAGALNTYAPPTGLIGLSSSSITSVGGSQAHLNMQPYLTLNFCISLQGIFPSQN